MNGELKKIVKQVGTISPEKFGKLVKEYFASNIKEQKPEPIVAYADSILDTLDGNVM